MNNNYDRDQVYHEEMRERGYEMTADGFWMGREHFTDEELQESVREVRNVKLLLLQSGDNVLANVTETMTGDEVILNNPKLVELNLASTNIETTIGYSDWQPLSNSRTFAIKRSYIVSVMEPLEELRASYEAQTNG